MKVIIIRDKITLAIFNTYIIDDDVVIDHHIRDNVLRLGFQFSTPMCYPYTLNQAALNREMLRFSY